MAATPKKEPLFLFLFGGAKKEGGTCARLIRESHMVGGKEGGKKNEMMERWSEKVKAMSSASTENILHC